MEGPNNKNWAGSMAAHPVRNTAKLLAKRWTQPTAPDNNQVKTFPRRDLNDNGCRITVLLVERVRNAMLPQHLTNPSLDCLLALDCPVRDNITDSIVCPFEGGDCRQGWVVRHQRKYMQDMEPSAEALRKGRGGIGGAVRIV